MAALLQDYGDHAPSREHRAPVVLGQVSRSDILSYLAERGQTLSPDCLDQVLTHTGGVAWLVSQALTSHEGHDCNAPQHLDFRHLLEAKIAHRLDTIEAPLRRMIEHLSFGHHTAAPDEAVADEFVAQGYAEGLLLRNGSPVPIVRSAVRASVPVHRIAGMGSAAVEELVAGGEDYPSSGSWLGGISDPRLGTALVAQADRLRGHDPRRAAELYRAALASGVEGAPLALGQSLAAWGMGDLDAAASFVDVALARDEHNRDDVVDTAAAVWAARGMMATGSDVYGALPPHSESSAVRATIAHVGTGAVERMEPAPADEAPRHHTTAPSTLSIALRLLDKGLRASLEWEPSPTALSSLVRASELYTSSRASSPLPELPAVIAAAVAVGTGDLATAHHVLESAVAGGHGGPWARRRLLLWKSWVALQSERPTDARRALAQAAEISSPHSPRDELLHQAILVSLARRYADLPTLESTWLAAVERIRHLEVDLFTLLPVGSLIASAARVGDDTSLATHLSDGLEILQRLGSPPLWTSRLRWAGVQRGILLNQPDLLAPHARALVEAAPHNQVAATMAHAGGVWVAVLGGAVEAEAVEHAARALAAVGLSWDGARLAGHGARRTDDRKDAARLLSCARELHPPEATFAPPDLAEQSAHAGTGLGVMHLSERELDVARMVLQGKTYAEIGETIFISPRTVEHHVANMRRRLAATSRSDLLAKLRLAIGASSGTGPRTMPRRDTESPQTRPPSHRDTGRSSLTAPFVDVTTTSGDET